MNLCSKCINVLSNPNDIICEECKKGLKIKNINEALDFSNESAIYKEFEEFIKSRSNKSVTYAYSGGQDSTAVLYLLKEMCVEYNVRLDLFTIDNGFKGTRTWENIRNVLEYLNLKDNHVIYDIRKDTVTDPEITKLFGEGYTKEEIYSLCLANNILPCGKICNKMMDEKYLEILKSKNEEYLITGGDTPKITNNKYSVFWEKKNGLKIVRGGAGFRISKNRGKEIIEEKKIPWTNPNYGGYDTDCMLPGTVFASENQGEQNTSVEEIIEKYSVVFEYLKERSRLEIIDRESAIKALNELDINDYSGYIEATNEVNKILVRRLNKNV